MIYVCMCLLCDLSAHDAMCLPFGSSELTDFWLLVWTVGHVSLDTVQYVHRNELICYSHADTDHNTNRNSNLNSRLFQPCLISAFIYGRPSPIIPIMCLVGR